MAPIAPASYNAVFGTLESSDGDGKVINDSTLLSDSFRFNPHPASRMALLQRAHG